MGSIDEIFGALEEFLALLVAGSSEETPPE